MELLAQYHVFNGEVVSKEELQTPLYDLGVLRGFGIFDYFITYQGRPFYLRDHVARFFRSASLIGLTLPYSEVQIGSWVMQALAANPAGEERAVRLVATAGVGIDFITPEEGAANVAVLIERRPVYSAAVYERGVSVITAKHVRNRPEVKSLDYLEAVIQTRHARLAGAVEAIYVDDEQLYEGTTSNLFVVAGDPPVIITPTNDRVLGGITRQVIMEELDLPFEITERKVTLADLKGAREVFITSSSKEIFPVVKIDQEPVGEGTPGEVTRRLIESFRQYASGSSWFDR